MFSKDAGNRVSAYFFFLSMYMLSFLCRLDTSPFVAF